MFRNIGFRNQLVIIFGIGILLLSVVSTLVISNLSAQTVRERLVSEGLKLAETFAEQSTLSLLYASAENAAEAASLFAAFPDIVGLEIVDAKYKTLYTEGTARQKLPDAQKWPGEPRLYTESKDDWEFTAPVIIGNDADIDSPFTDFSGRRKVIGYVRLVMSKDTLKRMEADILRYNFTVSITLASLLLLALLAITNRVTRPLQDLAKTMHRAERGEKNIRAELKGTSDIVIMENAFNTMMNVLEAREEALKAARDQALESAKAKGEFAANVSHELRTPMNAVLGMLELMSDTELSEKQEGFVGVAKKSAESLLKLIDDILDFSKNDADKASLELQEFSVEEGLDEIITLLGTQAQKKGIDFAYIIKPEIPSDLIGDGDRIRQVLVNLAGNAIKFTESGFVGIEVSLQELVPGRATLRFEVYDSGIGISKQEQSKIFDVFSQADQSTTRRFGGTGLGLAISRQLVQLMGGEIGVESEIGEGSRFWFTLPFLRQGEEKSRPVYLRVKPKGIKVLAADNCSLIRRSLGQFFKRQDIYFESASSYHDACSKLAQADRGLGFDIVIVDELLDGERGNDLLNHISSKPQYSGMHTILMAHRSATIIQPESTDASACIAKPVQHKHLVTCINNLFKPKGEGRQLPSPQTPTGIEPNMQAGSSYAGSRVLVVEDDRANQQVALGMLAPLNCSVDIANNGRECLEMVTRSHYDLILMDCHMPELDGYKATTMIRDWEGDKSHTPIIAMTANVMKGESDKCIAVGMDDYLAKPLSRDALVNALSRWLGDIVPAAQTEKPKAITPSVLSRMTAHQVESKDMRVIDTEVLDEMAQQLGPALDKAVSAFLEDLPVYLDSLDTALEQSNPVFLAEKAHTIKGAARNFGAVRLGNLSEKLEMRGRKGKLDDAREIIDEIFEVAHAVISQLQASQLSQRNQAIDVVQQNVERLNKEEQEQRASQSRILVVDDDRGSRFAMSEVLRKEGYSVDEVSDGQQALSYCEVETPDLILMDAVMPNMDGFTACALLQNLSQSRKVPVLIITALNDETSISKAFSSGAIDYISKPVNFAVLTKRIKRLVQASHAERHVHQLAYNDTLTGLPNRVMFTEHLAQLITRSQRDEGQLALMFLDLDRFKLVNDTLGHETGDLLLKYFAERVQGCLRKHDMVARFGGDEFTILLDRVKSREMVCNVAEKIHHQLSRPFVFMDREMYISTSIGIAMFPNHGDDIGALLKSADMAMYRAKSLGEPYLFYEPQMWSDASRRLELENDLRGALDRDEFAVFYQPQEDLNTGQVTAMEALVRWEHPTRGLVGPDIFIGLAEETGQIIPLGEWVLRTVCKQMQDWRERGYHVGRAAVNLSGKQISSPTLVDTVSNILAETGLPPEYIELEITESALMEDPEHVIQTLTQLKSMGLSLAIDDFGTGYSSLNYLKRFPIDIIKIDRSFVADIIRNQVDADIIKTIINLAHVLGVKVVAEGVETELQKAFLKNQGCDIAQGYYMSKPIPQKEFEEVFLVKAEGQNHSEG